MVRPFLIDGSGGGPFMFDEERLRMLTPSSTESLAIMCVRGDAMRPTLADGDHVLIDRADGIKRLRDGIYAIEVGTIVLVRRIASSLLAGRVTVNCDNSAYPPLQDCEANDLKVVGRAVWHGYRLV